MGSEFQGIVGAKYYVAPEMILNKSYDCQVDVWSSGVILFMMLTGRMPFAGEDLEIREAILNYDLTKLNYGMINTNIQKFLLKLLERDPAKRIKATQAIVDPWFTKKTGMKIPKLNFEYGLKTDENLEKATKPLEH